MFVIWSHVFFLNWQQLSAWKGRAHIQFWAVSTESSPQKSSNIKAKKLAAVEDSKKDTSPASNSIKWKWSCDVTLIAIAPVFLFRQNTPLCQYKRGNLRYRWVAGVHHQSEPICDRKLPITYQSNAARYKRQLPILFLPFSLLSSIHNQNLNCQTNFFVFFQTF